MEKTLSTSQRVSNRYIKTIIFLGINEVGKTSIIKALTKHKYQQTYQPTICVNYSEKEFILSPTETLYFCIWDTNGIEIETHILSPAIYKRADYFILVLSYDNLASLDTLSQYINFINTKQSNKKVPICVIINKKDIQDKQFKQTDVIKHLERLSGGNAKINISEITCKDALKVEKLFTIIGYELCGIKIPKGVINSPRQSRSKSNKGSNDDKHSDDKSKTLVSLRNSFRIEEGDKMVNGILNLSNDEIKKKKCC
jgi:small GTP-binding protein